MPVSAIYVSSVSNRRYRRLESNHAYILTHGVSGVDWRYYKHPLPDAVYDVYMKYWGDVSLKI